MKHHNYFMVFFAYKRKLNTIISLIIEVTNYIKWKLENYCHYLNIVKCIEALGYIVSVYPSASM